MPYADKAKRNEYQRNYKRKQAEELKRLRELAINGQITTSKGEKQ